MKVLLNRLKAAYVSIYLAVASVIAAYAAWQLLQGHDVLTWAGVSYRPRLWLSLSDF